MKLEAFDNDTLLWTMDPAEVATMPGGMPNLYVLSGVQTAAPVPPAPVFYPAFAGRNLTFSLKGADVQAWQDRLSHLGFPTDTAGLMDQASVDATKAFQSAQGIDPSGIVDEITWKAAFHPFVGE